MTKRKRKKVKKQKVDEVKLSLILARKMAEKIDVPKVKDIE